MSKEEYLKIMVVLEGGSWDKVILGYSKLINFYSVVPHESIVWAQIASETKRRNALQAPSLPQGKSTAGSEKSRSQLVGSKLIGGFCWDWGSLEDNHEQLRGTVQFDEEKSWFELKILDQQVCFSFQNFRWDHKSTGIKNHQLGTFQWGHPRCQKQAYCLCAELWAVFQGDSG